MHPICGDASMKLNMSESKDQVAGELGTKSIKNMGEREGTTEDFHEILTT